MNFHFRPQLTRIDVPNIDINLTHPTHLAFDRQNFLGVGNRINHLGGQIGAQGAGGSGTFERAMLQALDRVSAQHQFASELHQEAIINPGAVDVHDITIAQAHASMSLSIAHTVVNRIVQGWRDLIHIR